MALPGIAVFVVMWAFRDKRVWIIIVLGIATFLSLAVLEIEPFGRALLRFDAAWLEVVRQRCAFAFVTLWTWFDIFDVCSTTALFAIAWKLADHDERSLIRSVLLVGASGLGISILGSDIGGNVLAVNLQLWRVLWIVTLVGNAWIGVVMLRISSYRVSKEVLLICLFCAPFSRIVGAMDIASPVLLLLAGGMFLIEELTPKPVPSVLRIAVRFIAMSLVGVLVAFALFKAINADHPGVTIGQFCAVMISIAAAGLLIQALRQTLVRTYTVALGVLVIAAVGVADRRSEWTVFVEDTSVSPDLEEFASGTGNVYWEAGIELVWLKLRRPSYYSCLQGTGAMFYSGTALEYQRRSEGLSGLGTTDFAEDRSSFCYPKQSPSANGPVVREQLVASCKALPDVDTVVLIQPVLGATHEFWRAPVSAASMGESREPIMFYKYECADFRRSPFASGGTDGETGHFGPSRSTNIMDKTL
jgi:fumarate reductase subunit D